VYVCFGAALPVEGTCGRATTFCDASPSYGVYCCSVGHDGGVTQPWSCPR
jgi:hypothetical protein